MVTYSGILAWEIPWTDKVDKKYEGKEIEKQSN